MAKSSSKPSRIQGSAAIPFVNEGEVYVLLNPAPFIKSEDLSSAEQNGQPVLHHRYNTPWYLTVPGLNVTMQIEVDGEPLVGFVPKAELLRIADDLITQLRSLTPEQLLKYQKEVHPFMEWPAESRIRQTFMAGILGITD